VHSEGAHGVPCCPAAYIMPRFDANLHSITMGKAVGGVQKSAAQAIHDQVLRVEQVRIRSLPFLVSIQAVISVVVARSIDNRSTNACRRGNVPLEGLHM
jgi:hypothetical protein